jgi:KDO2-lipid IV(A) lauroyltransferase
MIIVSVHHSSFDLMMQTAALLGFKAQALSLPNPRGGYEIQNDMRRQVGLEITPASKSSIRQAIERLKGRGTVITGIDRPIPGTNYCPLFFGRPARVPVHHVQLALQANVPVYVVGSHLQADGTYEAESSDPIYMQPYSDRRTEILKNAESVLKVAADFIRRAPTQWSMYFPVWPEAEYELP